MICTITVATCSDVRSSYRNMFTTVVCECLFVLQGALEPHMSQVCASSTSAPALHALFLMLYAICCPVRTCSYDNSLKAIYGSLICSICHINCALHEDVLLFTSQQQACVSLRCIPN